jgi:endonuclease YncB( thermonuclease family)
MAWHFKKYSDEAALTLAEQQARSAKRGLWADPN